MKERELMLISFFLFNKYVCIYIWRKNGKKVKYLKQIWRTPNQRYNKAHSRQKYQLIKISKTSTKTQKRKQALKKTLFYDELKRLFREKNKTKGEIHMIWRVWEREREKERDCRESGSVILPVANERYPWGIKRETERSEKEREKGKKGKKREKNSVWKQEKKRKDDDEMKRFWVFEFCRKNGLKAKHLGLGSIHYHSYLSANSNSSHSFRAVFLLPLSLFFIYIYYFFRSTFGTTLKCLF